MEIWKSWRVFRFLNVGTNCMWLPRITTWGLCDSQESCMTCGLCDSQGGYVRWMDSLSVGHTTPIFNSEIKVTFGGWILCQSDKTHQFSTQKIRLRSVDEFSVSQIKHTYFQLRKWGYESCRRRRLRYLNGFSVSPKHGPSCPSSGGYVRS